MDSVSKIIKHVVQGDVEARLDGVVDYDLNWHIWMHFTKDNTIFNIRNRIDLECHGYQQVD